MNAASIEILEKNKAADNFSYEKLDISGLQKYTSEKLIEIYHMTNSKAILEILIKKNTNLVYKVAQEFKNNSAEYEDIIQTGMIGLLIAVNKFKSEKNYKFSTFAFFCIKGEIQHYLRDENLINFPRWLLKTNKLLSDFIKDFKIKYNRDPDMEEISKGLNISVQGIDEIMISRQSLYYHESLDIGDENKEFLEHALNEKLIKSRHLKSFNMPIEDRIILWDMIDKLTGRQKQAFISNYIIGLSQQEIGNIMGISQKSVSKYINEATRNLKDKLS